MRTFVVIVAALVVGFVIGIVLSEIIGMIGFVILRQAVGIRFLPIIIAIMSAGGAAMLDLFLRRSSKPPVSSSPVSRGRSPLVFVLGGCAVLAFCVLFACAASAGYWLYAQPITRDSQAPTTEMVRAEVQALPAGNASGGDQVFASAGCRACHSLEPSVRGVGPSLAGIAPSAATRKPDYAAEMYIYESIVSPKAYVVPGFNGDVMPEGFKQRLTPQQIADLLAFLMSE